MPTHIQGSNGLDNFLECSPISNSMLISFDPLAPGFSVAGSNSVTITDTVFNYMNSVLFVARLSPTGSDLLTPANTRALITRFNVCLNVVSSSAGFFVGSKLSLCRGSGAVASGGSALTVGKKLSTDSSYMISPQFFTTVPLTTTGIALDIAEIAAVKIENLGVVNGFLNHSFTFDSLGSHPIILAPGELIILRAPTGIDAFGGTSVINICVNMEWVEVDAI